MASELVTFKIRTQDLYAFKAEFAKLAKKAAKLKVESPTYAIVGSEVVQAKIVDVVDTDAQEDVFGRQLVSTVQKLIPGYEVKIITVSGQAPKLGGWTFVATLQHEEAGNIVRRVPATENVLVKIDLRTAKPYCGHCQTLRRRNDTYVVAHEDGRQLQIGRNCLRDFTGHDSPEAIARWAELLATFEESFREHGEGGFGGGGELCLTTESFLGFVALAIRETGQWLSRTKAREYGGNATADNAWGFAFPTPDFRRLYTNKGLPFPTPNDADIARAQRALEIAEKFFEDEEAAGRELEDYTHNLRIVIESKSVIFRSAGLAASIIQFSERLIGQEMERKRAAVSEHQGVVGKRTDFVLEVVRVIDIESQYGVSHLHILQDAMGNRFKWKASNEALDVGAKYKVKGTVKAHEEYKGAKQTTLSRCAASKIEVVEAA